jgi:RNA polymerase sigma-70 factor (ECF subfamily)
MIIPRRGGQAPMRLVQPAAQTSDSASDAPLRFSEVYREHARYVWRVCRGMGVSPLHVDDVVHDVFLVVRRRLVEFDPQRSIRAWLAGITRRVVGHLRRKLAREDRRLRALPEPEPVRSPHEAVQRHDAERLVQRFLDTLDADKRVAFLLLEIEGLTAKEVAEVCRTNPQTVYSRARVARQRFEAYVAELEGR